MTLSEAKALARALLNYESYDVEPSALLQFINDGERVVGQHIMDANPWIFAEPQTLDVTAATGPIESYDFTTPLVPDTPIPNKILTVATRQTANKNARYTWMPALDPVETFANAPGRNGYSQPYRQAWSYAPPMVLFSTPVAVGTTIVFMIATFPALTTDNAALLFGGRDSLLPYNYLVAYHAAILMGLAREQNVENLIAFYTAHLERVCTTLKESQTQALNHIPQLDGRVEI